MGSYDARRGRLRPLLTDLLAIFVAAAFLFAGTAAVVIAGPAGPASAGQAPYGSDPGTFYDDGICY